MAVFQVLGAAVLSVVLLVLLRKQRPEAAVLLSVAAGAAIFVFVIMHIGAVLDLLTGIAARAHLDGTYLVSLLRIIGVAYLAEFGAQVCRDAGEGALAGKVELAGKIFILLLAIPIVIALLESLLQLMPA